MKFSKTLVSTLLITLALVGCNNSSKTDITTTTESTTSEVVIDIQKLSGVLGNAFANLLETDAAKIESDSSFDIDSVYKNKNSNENVRTQSIDLGTRSITSYVGFNSYLLGNFKGSYSLPQAKLAYEYHDYVNDSTQYIPEAEFYGLDGYFYNGYIYLNTSESFVRKIAPYLMLSQGTYTDLDEAKAAVAEVPEKMRVEPRVFDYITWPLFKDYIGQYDSSYITSEIKNTLNGIEDLNQRVTFVQNEDRSYSISINVPKSVVSDAFERVVAMQEYVGSDAALSEEEIEEIRRDLRENLTINDFTWTFEISSSYYIRSYGLSADFRLTGEDTFEEIECNTSSTYVIDSKANVSYRNISVDIPTDIDSYTSYELDLSDFSI